MTFLLIFLMGKFSGHGNAVFHNGKTYVCNEIFLRMEATREEFKLREGGYNCGFLKASFDPFKLSIKEGKLYHQDQILGAISKDHLHYQVFDPADGSTYFLTLKLDEGGHLHYLEEWHDGEKIALKINGLLAPLPLSKN